MKPLSCLGILLFSIAGALAGPASNSKDDYERAIALDKKGDPVAALAAAKKAVEEDPDFVDAHDEFVQLSFKTCRDVYRDKGAGAYEKAEIQTEHSLESQYGEWAKAYPRSWGVMYGYGKFYWEAESPKAKPYLLKAVSANPKLGSAYSMLSIDAERWGDDKASRDFMGKAVAADPSNPSYALDYAFSWESVDPKKWVEMSLDVVKRFPANEQGAQALCWLGYETTSDSDRIHYWEQVRSQYPPSKFRSSLNAMTGLFDAYARTAPEKALALAQELEPFKVDYGNSWAENVALAKNLIEVHKLLDAKDFSRAAAILDASKISPYSQDTQMFDLLKAEAAAGAGNEVGAYGRLLERYAKTPEDAVREPLLMYGAKLGKSAEQVDRDVWAARDAAAKPAPDFNLVAYLTKGKKSLADFHGKAVLLTFWFPGCGPCQGEFPHFENVLHRFKGEPVSYVGINVAPSQDDYVRPFMRGNRYSFIPLREDGHKQETDYHVRGEPTNFLIDPAGRIVYSHFRAQDPESERVLELMIRSLLDHKSN